LLDEALATAERLARRSPAAVAALKRAVYEGSSRPLAEGLHIEQAGFLAAASTPAARRAMQVYAEEVEKSLGEGAPWQIETAFKRWQEGTAVDMVG
jgi:enoyl-CoA hydratase/carnithine racemase